MKDPYSILGVSPSATDEEIKAAYRTLARKYHPDNYDDDNPLKELATEKMQEINSAYDAIQMERAGKSYYDTRTAGREGGYQGNSGSAGGATGPLYIQIRKKIEAKRISEAERMLAEVGEYDRVAEWHFLMSVCLANRGRNIDAMRELEIACSMDPGNIEYQQAKEIFNTRAGGYGSAYYGDVGSAQYRRSDADRACDCCTNLICLDCLCECMGGDFIRCI